jgi:hypothetical protein
MSIWRIRIACWITKATNTLSRICYTYCFFLQQWLHERASLLRYTYIVCRVFITETECVYCAVRAECLYTIEAHCQSVGGYCLHFWMDGKTKACQPNGTKSVQPVFTSAVPAAPPRPYCGSRTRLRFPMPSCVSRSTDPLLAS